MNLHLFLMLALMCFLQTADALQQDNEFSYNTQASLSWLQGLMSGSSKPHSRKRRVIAVPVGSNLEVKWSLNFPFDTFTFHKAKLQLALPIKVPFPNAFIAGGGLGFGKRSIDAEYKDLQFVDSPNDITRPYAHWYQVDHGNQLEWHSRSRRAARQERSALYNHLKAAFDKAGLDGRSCLLRTICDVAEAPFEQGLFGEMINIILTPSLAGRPETKEERKEYDHIIEAELHGKLNGGCEERYHQCQVSLFDLLPYAVHQVL
nr:uncharacterized protein LOC128692527 [Cherax quadricarinatus]